METELTAKPFPQSTFPIVKAEDAAEVFWGIVRTAAYHAKVQYHAMAKVTAIVARRRGMIFGHLSRNSPLGNGPRQRNSHL